MVATYRGLEGCQTKQRVEKGKFQNLRRKGRVWETASKVTAKDLRFLLFLYLGNPILN